MAQRVGFQGERGAFSEMAARAALGEQIELTPHRSFNEVFEAVQTGGDDLGIIAIEKFAGREYPRELRPSAALQSTHRRRDAVARRALPDRQPGRDTQGR